MAEKTHQTAIDFSDLNSDSIVIDAYSGIRTIVCHLPNRSKKFTALKSSKQPLKMPRKNAERNGITNAHYVADSAENAMAKWSRMVSNQTSSL